MNITNSDFDEYGRLTDDVLLRINRSVYYKLVIDDITKDIVIDSNLFTNKHGLLLRRCSGNSITIIDNVEKLIINFEECNYTNVNINSQTLLLSFSNSYVKNLNITKYSNITQIINSIIIVEEPINITLDTVSLLYISGNYNVNFNNAQNASLNHLVLINSSTTSIPTFKTVSNFTITNCYKLVNINFQLEMVDVIITDCINLKEIMGSSNSSCIKSLELMGISDIKLSQLLIEKLTIKDCSNILVDTFVSHNLSITDSINVTINKEFTELYIVKSSVKFSKEEYNLLKY